MDHMHFLVCCAATAYLGYVLYSGRIWINMRHGTESLHTSPGVIDREQWPFFYWLYTGLGGLLVLALWFR